MIAAVAWIPAGVAAETPTKYEYSKAEQEFLERVANANGDGDLDPNNDDDAEEGDDGEWEDVEEENNVVVPKVDVNSLPADLRMDEYSDDEGDEGKGIGNILVGKDAEMIMEESEEADEAEEPPSQEREYDSDSDVDDDLHDVPDTREFMPLDVAGLQSLGIGGGNNEGYTMADLKNMTDNDVYDDDLDDDEDDEDYLDDVRIREGDALIVVAKTEDDYASLEINIFDTQESNLYVHHDIPLPSFPLCLALGNVIGGQSNSTITGNYCAVGSFETGIEIWNLDVMNALEPSLVLGGMDTRGLEEDWMRMQSTMAGGTGGKKKKKGKASAPSGLREGSHTDAVMGLSWNTIHRQVLASGSADGTVKLWDVTHATAGKNGDYVRPSATLTHHSDKVQSLAWHPSEGTLLATGGYDRRICLVDARSAASKANAGSVKKAKLLADCEAIAWDPFAHQYLTAASEDGIVQCWDVRKFGEEPVWSMLAHEYGGVSDICYNPLVPGMLITCSIDKTVALWDTQQCSPTPQSCGTKDMNVGKLHSVNCYPSSPWLMGCGGSGNELAIWDMEDEEPIKNRFASRVSGAAADSTSNSNEDGKEADFEAMMSAGDDNATQKALEAMNKSKKKKKAPTISSQTKRSTMAKTAKTNPLVDAADAGSAKTKRKAKTSSKQRTARWTDEEVKLLRDLIPNGVRSGTWKYIASHFTSRTAQNCREKYLAIAEQRKKGQNWTQEEDNILISLQEEMGNKWKLISKSIVGRSENDVKNRWYSLDRIRRRKLNGDENEDNASAKKKKRARATRKKRAQATQRSNDLKEKSMKRPSSDVMDALDSSHLSDAPPLPNIGSDPSSVMLAVSSLVAMKTGQTPIKHTATSHPFAGEAKSFVAEWNKENITSMTVDAAPPGIMPSRKYTYPPPPAIKYSINGSPSPVVQFEPKSSPPVIMPNRLRNIAAQEIFSPSYYGLTNQTTTPSSEIPLDSLPICDSIPFKRAPMLADQAHRFNNQTVICSTIIHSPLVSKKRRKEATPNTFTPLPFAKTPDTACDPGLFFQTAGMLQDSGSSKHNQHYKLPFYSPMTEPTPPRATAV